MLYIYLLVVLHLSVYHIICKIRMLLPFLNLLVCITTLFFLISRYVPESPSWLLVSGEREKAKDVLQYIARENGESLPSFELEELKSGNESKPTIFSVFSFPKIAKQTLLLILCW